MKTLLLLIATILLSIQSLSAQNIFKKLHERNLAHDKQIEENDKQHQLQEKILLQTKNPGLYLRQGSELLTTGIIIQSGSLVAGNLILNSDKPSKDAYVVMAVGTGIGLVLEIAGLNKIIKAGKYFEVKIGTQN